VALLKAQPELVKLGMLGSSDVASARVSRRRGGGGAAAQRAGRGGRAAVGAGGGRGMGGWVLVYNGLGRDDGGHYNATVPRNVF
jgi:hypothetical protein